MEGIMATVTCFAADFAPKHWALCNGQILPISSNQALFSLLGATFGGNGVTNFALPDLRGRRPVSAGQGIGLRNYALGEKVGNEAISLSVNQIPPHNHNGTVNIALDVDSTEGSVTRAANTYPAGASNAYSATHDSTMAQPKYDVNLGFAGGGLPMPVLMPYLVVNYIICIAGIYPSRN